MLCFISIKGKNVLWMIYLATAKPWPELRNIVQILYCIIFAILFLCHLFCPKWFWQPKKYFDSSNIFLLFLAKSEKILFLKLSIPEFMDATGFFPVYEKVKLFHINVFSSSFLLTWSKYTSLKWPWSTQQVSSFLKCNKLACHVLHGHIESVYLLQFR